jgi:hypothetical protein
MADDDEDDCMLAHEALIESRLANDLHFVKDGEELMDYLYHRGQYAAPKQCATSRLNPARSEYAQKRRS